MAMDTDTHPIESPLSHSPMHLHREPSTLYTEPAFAPSPPTAHANETGNVPPGTMDETMDDDTKDPGPFQQRNDPAAEPEDAAAESMDETMDGDLAAATPNTKLKNKSEKQTQDKPRNTKGTRKRNANKMNKRRARQATKAGGTPTE